MATWDDVSRIARRLPESTEEPTHDQHHSWRVRDKTYAWERPLQESDLAELGDAAPDGPVLCAAVPDVGARAALIADSPRVYFTIAHLHGYPAVLVRLEEIETRELAQLLDEAWACRAPRRLVTARRR
jgi:hypothetical protein